MAAGRNSNWARCRRVWSAVAATALVLGACSSDGSKASTSSAPTSAGVESLPTLPTDLRDKEAVDSLNAMVVFAGLDPTVAPDTGVHFALTSCPLGDTTELTSNTPMAGLQTRPAFRLDISRNGAPTVRCSFTAQTSANGTVPADPTTAPSIEYQATFVPGTQLNNYFTELESAGYDRNPEPVSHGALFTRCTAADTATPTTDVQPCAAIWLNGVILVGVQYAAPDIGGVDINRRLIDQIEPIVTSLATATPSDSGLTPISTP